RSRVERWWMGIERHVTHGGYPARGGGGRAAAKALPVGAAGLVEVDMGIDQTGQHVQAAGVERLVRVTFTGLEDLSDATVLDQHVGGARHVVVDQHAAADEQRRHWPPSTPRKASSNPR